MELVKTVVILRPGGRRRGYAVGYRAAGARLGIIAGTYSLLPPLPAAVLVDITAVKAAVLYRLDFILPPPRLLRR